MDHRRFRITLESAMRELEKIVVSMGNHSKFEKK